ncbi:MAG: hypothetical protein ACOYEF_09435 [Planifilum sp.]|jgi:hypothetical protein
MTEKIMFFTVQTWEKSLAASEWQTLWNNNHRTVLDPMETQSSTLQDLPNARVCKNLLGIAVADSCANTPDTEKDFPFCNRRA